jgi:hypothetical protein
MDAAFFGVALGRGWVFFLRMRLRCRSLAVLLGVGAVAAFAAEPAATEPAKPALDNLVKNSPFGSAASPAIAGAESGQLEFRGVMVDKGETFFSLFEPSTRQSQWVGLNESGAPYTVQDYDSATQTVKVLYRNQPLSLTLKRSQVIVQAAPPVASGGGPVPAPGAAPAVAASASPDEAARLAQVAEEIRRRRALRAQGGAPVPVPQPAPANATSPGGPPQPNRR